MRKLSFDQFGVMSVGYQQYSLEYTLDSISGEAPRITVPLILRQKKDRKKCWQSGRCWMTGG